MALRITILEGPGAGQVFDFGDDVDFVEIGRDPQHCGVLFPADYTVVGRRHLGIRRTLGSYELDVKQQNPVRIDGREPFDGEPLGATQELRLGPASGPRIRIEATMTSELPATEFAGTMASTSQVAHKQKRTVRRLAAALVAVVALASAGYGGLYYRQVSAEAQLQSMVASIDNLDVAPRIIVSEERITPEMLEHVRNATYLVIAVDPDGNEQPFGTAWAVGDGVLATNAHVAEVFHEVPQGHRIVVRSTVAPHPTIRVREVRLHPHYEPFNAEWERRSPARAGSGTSVEVVDAPGAGYDVALMFTEAGRLEAPIELASDEELARLSGGHAVALVGFPMENLAGGGVHPDRPVPQTQTGYVTAVTDYFLLPSSGHERNLVMHSLPGTGGASGSAIIDASGKVVAVMSGMNIIIQGMGGRAPSAAGVNFAQSAGLVRELLEGRTQQIDGARRQAWADGFATFDDLADRVPNAFYTEWVDSFDPGVEPVTVAQRQGQLNRTGDYWSVTFNGMISEPGHYLLIAMSRGRHDIDMAVARNGEALVADTYDDWYPVVEYEHDGNGALDVVIFAGTSERPDYELRVWMVR